MGRFPRQRPKRLWPKGVAIDARRKRFGIIVSRFNELITKRLLAAAVKTLVQHGASAQQIDTFWVPGALEIPFFAKKLARRRPYTALIVLGCVLRGDTFHFETVCNEVTRGVSQVALETGVPIASGVITADTLKEANERAGVKRGNKGGEAALAALEIAALNRALS